MDLFVFVLITIILYKSKYKRAGQYEDYLSKNYCTCIKGICAFLILFHHLSQNTQSFGLLWNRFPLIGGMVVSVFFFLSGYGLFQSLIRNPQYTNGFWSRRIPTLLVPYILVAVFYYAAHNLLNTSCKISFSNFMINLFGPRSIVTYSWFVTAMLLFYIIFYASARLALPIHPKRFVTFILIGVTTYYITCIFLHYDQWWYLSVYAFPLGLLYSMKEKSFIALIDRHFAIIYLSCLFLFSLTFLTAIFCPASDDYHFLPVMLFQTAYLFFPLCTIFAGRKVQFHNKLLHVLGKLSLEIYLTQGLFMFLFRNDFLWIKNDFLFALLVICFTIPGAALLHGGSHILLQAITLICHRKRNASTTCSQ